MAVWTKEAPVSAFSRNGLQFTFKSQFDPCEEPQPTKVPGEGVEDFKRIAPHEHSEFSPIMRYDPSRVADHILKNGRHP